MRRLCLCICLGALAAGCRPSGMGGPPPSADELTVGLERAQAVLYRLLLPKDMKDDKLLKGVVDTLRATRHKIVAALGEAKL